MEKDGETFLEKGKRILLRSGGGKAEKRSYSARIRGGGRKGSSLTLLEETIGPFSEASSSKEQNP